MKLFTTAPATVEDLLKDLRRWEDAPAVVKGRARVSALNSHRAESLARAKALKRTNSRPDLYDGIVLALPPGHPYHAAEAAYQEDFAAATVAAKELAEVEDAEKAACAVMGYQVGRDFFDSEIAPLVEQLRQALARYAHLQDEVEANTSARLGDLGSLPMQASRIEDWTRNATRGTFGSAGG